MTELEPIFWRISISFLIVATISVLRSQHYQRKSIRSSLEATKLLAGAFTGIGEGLEKLEKRVERLEKTKWLADIVMAKGKVEEK